MDKKAVQELEAQERRKYLAAWNLPKYREHCHGLDVLSSMKRALKMLEPTPTFRPKVVDFGCGTGRAAQRLQEDGYRAIGVDFARNAPDEGYQFQFVEAPLWEIPKLIWGHYGLCTDVLEHIPLEMMDKVLHEMKWSITRGIYLQICTEPDGHWEELSLPTPLHMTVRPESWWRSTLKTAFAGSTLEFELKPGYINAAIRGGDMHP